MKTIRILALLVLAFVVIGWQSKVSKAEPLGTAFTYQGRLTDASEPADGLYDFQFKLYDSASDGNQIGGDVNVPNVNAIDGYFTVELDFGSDVFNGDARWLEIGVRPGELNDPNEYTILLTRQEVTPTPYALQTRGIFVDNAGNVGIGTTSPGEKLDVAGDAVIGGNLYENQPFSYAGKKIEIISPYVKKSNVYKGQLHCHTTNSADAVDTPTALLEAYRYAGYDFVAITDHDYLTPTPDPPVSGILHIPGVEESATDGNERHILSINPTSAKRRDEGLTAAQDIIDAIIADGAVPFICHPNFSGDPQYPWTDAQLEAVIDYFGMEVYNKGSPGVQNAEDKWDKVLTRYVRCFGTAVDDCHNVKGTDFNKAWVQVFADTCTKDEIVDALKRGNFYSTTGPTLSISVSKRTITATMESTKPSTIEWIGSDGSILRSVSNATSDSYDVVGDEIYVRVKITDSDNKNAWSNPIYIYQSPTSELRKGGIIRGNAYITGNVGIGTTSPGQKLEVKGANPRILIDATSGIPELNLHAYGKTTWAIYQKNLIGDLRFYQAADKITFQDGTGNVGIGTTSPAAKLAVNGGILRSGSTMYGTNSNTHINLGVNSTTGESGPNNQYATVGGGSDNTARSNWATVGGGYNNLAYNSCATIGGGYKNTASGSYATICGGLYNTASGSYSFAAGRRAKANHNGAFVWADSTDANFASTGNDQFLIRASGGVGIGTTSPAGKLDVNGSIYQRGSMLHADYVFDPEYELESIQEHSEFMWRNKHLSAIPKAQVDETGQEIIEIGAHRRGIVEELEKAHIYIEQLHKNINQLQEQNRKLQERISAIETIMNELAAGQEGGAR